MKSQAGKNNGSTTNLMMEKNPGHSLCSHFFLHAQQQQKEQKLKTLAKLESDWFTDQNGPMHSSWLKAKSLERVF